MPFFLNDRVNVPVRRKKKNNENTDNDVPYMSEILNRIRRQERKK
jgi:hypothetical protein